MATPRIPWRPGGQVLLAGYARVEHVDKDGVVTHVDDPDELEGVDIPEGGSATLHDDGTVELHDEPVSFEGPLDQPEPTNAEVRAWAAQNDIDVAPTGRIARSVIERYKAAQRS